MTTISNEAELRTWAETGGTGTLTSDITLTANSINGAGMPVTVQDNSILDGNGHTITIHSTSEGGMFKVVTDGHTFEVKNLKIDADALIDTNASVGILVKNINNSNLTLTFRSCAVVGVFDIIGHAGGLLGRIETGMNGFNVTFDKCYVSGPTITGSAAGALVGAIVATGTLTVTECYSTCNVTGGSAGALIGSGAGRNGGGLANVSNCYSTGSISGSNAGGITGSNNGISGGTVNIYNCYSFGTLTGSCGGICGLAYGGTTIGNCFAKHATGGGVGAGQLAASQSGTPTFGTNGFGGGSWSPNLGTDLLDSYGGNTDVWITAGGFSTGYGLTTFNQSPWDVDTSYTSNTSTAEFGSIYSGTMNITSQTDLNNWPGGGTGTLTQDITLTSNSSLPKTLINNSTLNGAGYTITLMSANTGGLFGVGDSSTVTIQDLKVDADAITTTDAGMGVLFSELTDVSNSNVTIEGCSVLGDYTTGAHGGCLFGRYGGTVANCTVTIDRCNTTGTVGDTSGGIIGGSVHGADTYIYNCRTTGEISGSGAGGIVGSLFSRAGSGTDSHIKNCYTTGDISGNRAGGIVGEYARAPHLSGGGPDWVIEGCYSFGDITGTDAGGILGADAGTGVVRKCYVKNASVAGVGTRRFVKGEYSGNTVTINNSRGRNNVWSFRS